MQNFFYLWFFVVSCFFAATSADVLRVMTFNILKGGSSVTDGLAKIAKHVIDSGADIVALQETSGNATISPLLKLLGSKWQGRPVLGWDSSGTGILTKEKIIVHEETLIETAYARGIKIQKQLSNKSLRNISVWSAHFSSKAYGPYAACNKLCTEQYQIFAGELASKRQKPGRVESARNLVDNRSFEKAVDNSDLEPLILMGDFNTPSHLDWVEETRSQHCNWTFEWPVTTTLETTGFTDAYRTIHPNPSRDPGITWSATYKTNGEWGNTIPEPQDRIDYVFYKSQRLYPLRAHVYNGQEEINPHPYNKNNDWPSDHNAVVVDFEIF